MIFAHFCLGCLPRCCRKRVFTLVERDWLLQHFISRTWEWQYKVWDPIFLCMTASTCKAHVWGMVCLSFAWHFPWIFYTVPKFVTCVTAFLYLHTLIVKKSQIRWLPSRLTTLRRGIPNDMHHAHHFPFIKLQQWRISSITWTRRTP